MTPVLALWRPAAVRASQCQLRRVVTTGSSQKLRLEFGAAYVPKASDTEGEDAFFASPGTGCFGIADGVGSWTAKGVDAGVFSRSLLTHAIAELARARRPNLPGALKEARDAVLDEGTLGSCTVVLGQLHLDTLHILNVGDSGVYVLRPWSAGGASGVRCFYHSTPLLHKENMPHQLSYDDEKSDPLEEFDLVQLQVREGDVVIASSDGLWDNVANAALESLVLQHVVLNSQTPPRLVEKILSVAAAAARLPAPVEDAASGRIGGKLDDIAVVVAKVVAGPALASQELFDNLSGALLRQSE